MRGHHYRITIRTHIQPLTRILLSLKYLHRGCQRRHLYLHLTLSQVRTQIGLLTSIRTILKARRMPIYPPIDIYQQTITKVDLARTHHLRTYRSPTHAVNMSHKTMNLTPLPSDIILKDGRSLDIHRAVAQARMAWTVSWTRSMLP